MKRVFEKEGSGSATDTPNDLDEAVEENEASRVRPGGFVFSWVTIEPGRGVASAQSQIHRTQLPCTQPDLQGSAIDSRACIWSDLMEHSATSEALAEYTTRCQPFR